MFSRGRDAFFQSLESPPKRVYPGRLKKRLPRAEQAVSAVSYLVVGPATRGKFDAATATKLGIVKGPDRGRLTRGESVTLADGRVVTPDMCIGPSVPPSVRRDFAYDEAYPDLTCAGVSVR